MSKEAFSTTQPMRKQRQEYGGSGSLFVFLKCCLTRFSFGVGVGVGLGAYLFHSFVQPSCYNAKLDTTRIIEKSSSNINNNSSIMRDDAVSVLPIASTPRSNETAGAPTRKCNIQLINPFCRNKNTRSSFWPPDRTNCNGLYDVDVTLMGNYSSTADIFLAHYFDSFDPSMLAGERSDDGPINVLWGVENAAFTPALKNASILELFDYVVKPNVKTAAFPIYSFLLPPTKGHRVPPFEERPNFAMFAWSHCEPVRTKYAGRMMDYAHKKYDLKVASLAKCLNNDNHTTFAEIDAQGICPSYNSKENWNATKRDKCDRRSGPDMAARSYKFSLVFQNADCDYWIDLRLSTAFSSGSVVVFMGTKKSLLETFVPPALMNAMIFAEDHNGPEELVDAMAAMTAADYQRRMAWTNGYDASLWDRAVHNQAEPNICKLCRLRFDGVLGDGHRPQRRAIKPDLCVKRRESDWLYSSSVS